MRPLDPRLLRRATAARRWVVLSAGLQILSAVLLVVQAVWLAGAVAAVVGGAPASIAVVPALVLGPVLIVRALLAGIAARYAERAATTVIVQLRSAVLDHVDETGLAGRSPADVTTLVSTGLDQLDGYLVRYLPQLLATAVVTPMLLVVVATQDLISAAIMAVTLPLVPFFMALVGWTTQKLSDERIAKMRRLGDQLLDLVAGLPTLRALGRALPQAARVRAVGEAYRASTTSVLKIAFLSGFVLELLTTISVALVAVGIGMRLVYGEMALATGLTVLILAPEVYLPLRMVGQHFHASTDGIAAANAVLNVLDECPEQPDAQVPGRLAPATVRAVSWQEVTVQQPGREVAAPAGFSGLASAGRITALVGENGSGKSTAIAVLLGLRAATAGTVLLHPDLGGDQGAIAVGDVDPRSWREQVAWLPQHPLLVAGSLRDNVELLVPDPTDAELAAAADRVGLGPLVGERAGWQRVIGDDGVGLSGGQRHRLALARTLIRVSRGAGVVIADEPSAHLDPGTEDLVLRVLRELADDGLIVIVVAHRPRLVAAADNVLTVHGRRAEASPALSGAS